MILNPYVFSSGPPPPPGNVIDPTSGGGHYTFIGDFECDKDGTDQHAWVRTTFGFASGSYVFGYQITDLAGQSDGPIFGFMDEADTTSQYVGYGPTDGYGTQAWRSDGALKLFPNGSANLVTTSFPAHASTGDKVFIAVTISGGTGKVWFSLNTAPLVTGAEDISFTPTGATYLVGVSLYYHGQKGKFLLTAADMGITIPSGFLPTG